MTQPTYGHLLGESVVFPLSVARLNVMLASLWGGWGRFDHRGRLVFGSSAFITLVVVVCKVQDMVGLDVVVVEHGQTQLSSLRCFHFVVVFVLGLKVLVEKEIEILH